jgi:DNA repair exonuclease SbcCD ATPase subunit
MAANSSESQKPSDVHAESNSGAATDEEILRLRSRLDRELAMVAQKLSDAEEEILDMEMAVRAQEHGSRPRLPGGTSPLEKGTEKITARIKAVGDGISKIKEWVVKRDAKEGEAQPAPETKPQARGPAADLEERLDETLRSITLEIREREQKATELDRKLHEAQKELIKKRAEEQHVREMQVRIGETKQLSEDLERKMAALDSMVRSYETSTKTDTGFRKNPKEPAPAAPKFEDRLQAAINDALKSVADQEKKVTEIEKELAHANASLVEERTRQQRVRTMQMKLRQARHFSNDLHRALAGMASSIDSLRNRAANLLRPDLKAVRKVEKPAAAVPEAAPPMKAANS